MIRKPDLRKLDKDELIRLMELSNHLKETMLAVIALGEATATEVSEQTGQVKGEQERPPEPAGEDGLPQEETRQ